MKKTLSIVLFVLLVFLAVACSPEHTHDYKLVPEKSLEATCTANGYNYMQCSCGAIQSIPTAVLGHDYVVDEERSSASTCIKKGNIYKVCSRCEDVKNVDLPLDPANHPFYYNKGTTEYPEYVGVFKYAKDDGAITIPTCANDGEAVFTECSACGKTGEFKVTIPSAEFVKYITGDDATSKVVSGHVKVNAKGDGYEEITAKDVKEWKTLDEETAFVSGKKTAYCPTCEKLVTTDSSKADLVNQTVTNDRDEALGFWTVKTAKADATKNYDIYYLSVSKKNGSYTVSGYKMNVDANGKYTTGSESNLSASWASEGGSTGTLYQGAETLTFNSSASEGGLGNNKTFILTEATKAGSDALTNSVAKHDKLLKIGDDVYKLDEPTVHEHNLTLMNDQRAVAKVDSTTGHYLECADCGLKYIFETHVSGCEVCDWTTSWYMVNIGKSSVETSEPTEGEIFYVKDKPSYTLASSGTYNYFVGGSFEYNKLTAITDGSTYDTAVSSNTFTLKSGSTKKAIGIGLSKN